MAKVQIEIPEELYTFLRALGYQKEDIEKELLEDAVFHLYAKHLISIGKAASILGLSIQAFREILLKKHMPVEYLTEEVYEEDLKTLRELKEKNG